VHRAIEEPWQEYGGALRVDGATRLRSIRMLLAIARRSVLTAVLAGFGRTVSEVGAVLIVGGNIAGYTDDDDDYCAGDEQRQFGIGARPRLHLNRHHRGRECRRFCAWREAIKAPQCFTLAFVLFLGHASIAAEQSSLQSIILASTTSVENSGLLAAILPAFTKETGTRSLGENA